MYGTREGIGYKLECVRCEEDLEVNILYIGETSRSGRERVKEHLWLFTHKKEACPEICMRRHKCSSSDSALWRHSKEAHGGTLGWRIGGSH